MHRLETNSLTSKSIKLQQLGTLQFMATLQRTTTTNLTTNNRNWNKWTNTLITMETNNRVLIIQTKVIKILLFTLAECWLILALVAVISFIYAFFSVWLHPLPSFGCLPGFLNVFLVHRAVHLWFWFVAPLPIVEQPEKGHLPVMK